MWTNFYTDGGWGMYPTSLFGFLLVAASVLYSLRPSSASARIVFALGAVTLLAGLLGTVTGLCTTFRYIQQVALAEQLQIMADGCQESLNNTVLSLIIVIVAILISLVGLLRGFRNIENMTARAATNEK